MGNKTGRTKKGQPVKYDHNFAVVREELAWAAGFFDGEGTSFAWKQKRWKGRVACCPRLTVSQVERGPLERFNRAVAGLGNVTGPYGDTSKRRPYFRWDIAGNEGGQAVLAMLWPFLSEPKRKQAHAAFLSAANFDVPRGQ